MGVIVGLISGAITCGLFAYGAQYMTDENAQKAHILIGLVIAVSMGLAFTVYYDLTHPRH
jgi:ABC-type Mn2+/Zn2+ transport system permease subunit